MRSTNRHGWWGDLGRVAAACAALAAVISAAGVRAAEETATNIDVMQRLTAQVVAELHGRFNGAVAGRTVQLKPAGTTEDYVFVTNVFREELIRLGVATIDPDVQTSARTYTTPASGAAGAAALVANQQPDSTGPAGDGQPPAHDASPAPDPLEGTTQAPLTLRYQNVVFALQYVDSHRAYMIGGKRMDRSASVRITSTLTDETGRVLWVGEATRDHTDEIDYGEAARVEQGSYQFAKPVAPVSGWGRIVEPVFVTGIVVGLIYLFFSNQSDN